MTREDETPEVMAYRLRNVEQQVEQKADAEDVAEIRADVRGLRKVLIGFIVAVAGSAVLYSFTTAQLLAHHP